MVRIGTKRVRQWDAEKHETIAAIFTNSAIDVASDVARRLRAVAGHQDVNATNGYGTSSNGRRDSLAGTNRTVVLGKETGDNSVEKGADVIQNDNAAVSELVDPVTTIEDKFTQHLFLSSFLFFTVSILHASLYFGLVKPHEQWLHVLVRSHSRRHPHLTMPHIYLWLAQEASSR